MLHLIQLVHTLTRMPRHTISALAVLSSLSKHSIDQTADIVRAPSSQVQRFLRAAASAGAMQLIPKFLKYAWVGYIQITRPRPRRHFPPQAPRPDRPSPASPRSPAGPDRIQWPQAAAAAARTPHS